MDTISHDTMESSQKTKKTDWNRLMVKAGLYVVAGVGLTMLGRTQADLNITSSNLEQEKARHTATRIQANHLLHQAFRSNFTYRQLQESDQAWEGIQHRHWVTKDSLRMRSYLLAGTDTLQLDAQGKADLKAEIASTNEASKNTHNLWIQALQQWDLSRESNPASTIVAISKENFLSDAHLDEKTKAIHFQLTAQY